VFIEEVDAGPKPIEGVSTSTAGAVGVTTFGPTSGKPVLVTSFAEFVRTFGPPVPEPTGGLFNKWAREKEGGRWWEFALSIKGFFDNGGQRIFVKRVFSKNSAKAAAAEFGQGLLSEVDADAGAGATSLKLRHLIGIFKGKVVTIFDPDFVGAFEVLSYDTVSRTVRLDRALGKALQAGKSFVQIARPAPQQTTFKVQAKALGRWGNDLRVQMRPMVGTTASLLADPATSSTTFKTSAVSSLVTWSIRIDDATALSKGETIKIKGRPYRISDFTTDTDGTGTIEIQSPPPDVLTREEALGSASPKLRIQRDNGFSTKVKTKALAGQDKLVLKEIGTTGSVIQKLFKGDRIAIGTGANAKEFDLRDVTEGDKTVQVDTLLTSDIDAEVEVKKISTNVLSGGTLTKNTLKKLDGIIKDDFIVFVPTGKRFKVVDDPVGTTIKIAPAIPLGFDWIGRPIQKIGPKAADVAEKPSAGSPILKVHNVTDLHSGNTVRIGHTRYMLVAEPVLPNPPSGETTIQVAPPFATDDLPDAEAPIFKLGPEILVTDNAADWTLTVADATGLNDGDHVLIKGEEIAITKKVDKELSFSVLRDSGDPWAAGSVVRRLLPANAVESNVVNVSGASQLYKGALVELDNGTQKDIATIESIVGDAVTLSIKVPSLRYREGHKMRVVEAEIEARQVVNNQTVQQESFSNLRLLDDKTSSFFITAVKNASSLIEIAQPLGPGFPDTPAKLADILNFPASTGGGFATLGGGDDGLDDLTVDDFVGEDGGSGKRTGIQALEDIDEVSICLAPDVWAPTVHSALLLHCETLKDRFAILDPQDGLNIEQIRDVKENLDSKYAALYYPWIEVRDPSVGRNVQVAPSGHVAGIYARVDVERGVHKAPANEIIRGITRIADEVTKREQDLLNPKGINALRFFPGRGNRVWGARTISSDSSWKYVNVRRLFIFVEESIDEGTQFVVFEPNAEPTWARVRQTITNFLTTVWRSGALEGTTADQAFFVKCDRTTMSQDDIDNGRLICVIGIAPVKPAEFVIFRIQQMVKSNTN
jgi:uncharacterized protein